MQNIISANQKSITESESLKLGSNIPFYSASKAIPEIGIQFQKVTPYIAFTGAIAGNSLTFKFPPSGFLYDASLEFLCTYTVATADLPGYVGLNLINQLDWLSNGQPVLTQTGAAIRALIKTLPIAEQTFAYRHSLMLNPTTEALAANADASFVTYCPLIASWLSSEEKCLLLSVIGDLQLRVSFNTQVVSGLTNAVTAVSSTLYLQTYMPKLSVYQEMLVSDWSKKLVMECSNTYTEVVPLTSATTLLNYQITCPFLVFRTHMYVQRTSGVNIPPITYDINTVTLSIGGVTFLDSFRKSRLLRMKTRGSLGSVSVSNADAITYDSKEYAVIDWGIMSTRDRNTGTAFFQELRGSVLSLTFDTVTTAAESTVYIVHEYWNNISFNPGNSGSGLLMVENNN